MKKTNWQDLGFAGLMLSVSAWVFVATSREEKKLQAELKEHRSQLLRAIETVSACEHLWRHSLDRYLHSDRDRETLRGSYDRLVAAAATLSAPRHPRLYDFRLAFSATVAELKALDLIPVFDQALSKT